MKIDKVLLATTIFMVVLVVILATHMSTKNTFFILTPPNIMSDNQTPASFVYNITDNQSTIYYMPPEMAWVEAHDYRCYPILVDHRDGNVTFLLIGSMSKQYPEYTSVRYYFIANASMTYEIYTINSPSDPRWIVGHIIITDNMNSDNQNLSIKITPLTDGNGNVSITFRTPEGKYSLNGTIEKPLNIEPGPVCIVASGLHMDNGSIEYNNRSMKLTAIYARNEMYYVTSEELI